MSARAGPPAPEPGSSAELRIRIDEAGGVTVLVLTGELDMTVAAQLSDALTTRCPLPEGRLVVDLSGLAFMDLAGLHRLLCAHSRLLEEGRAGIIVRGASGTVRRIFEVTGFMSLLGNSGGELELGRRHAGMSLTELFVAYFALGGTADFAGMAAHLRGSAEVLDAHQQDVAAHALNERLADLGRAEHLLSYATG
jgi:anti-anti-sigma factor